MAVSFNKMIPPLGEGGTQRRDRPYCVTLWNNLQVLLYRCQFQTMERVLSYYTLLSYSTF